MLVVNEISPGWMDKSVNNVRILGSGDELSIDQRYGWLMAALICFSGQCCPDGQRMLVATCVHELLN